ncbi:hypothetical protein NMD85_00905 [Edwardsiella tarda]
MAAGGLPATLVTARSLHTATAGLSAAERRRNLRGAFTCHPALTGRRVLLVDDVVTTGSTLSEISQRLIAQGVMSVEVICLCRTL